MPRRIAQSKAWFALVLATLVLAAASVALVISVAQSAHQRVSTDRKICLAVSRVDKTIQAQLQRGLVNLPKIKYYQQHPDELARQQIEIGKEIDAFKPLKCK
jgi:hypothetical protein